MQIMVCGSIGYGGAIEIKRMYSLLKKEGFAVLNHIISKGMDYSHIKDFRYEKELSAKIVGHDLEYVSKADVVVVLVNKASYGSAIEMFVARQSKKRIILFAKNPIPTPWPIHFSDYVVTTEEALLRLLREIDR
jgi:nucleoside 2-deoxyribosyltransferase